MKKYFRYALRLSHLHFPRKLFIIIIFCVSLFRVHVSGCVLVVVARRETERETQEVLLCSLLLLLFYYARDGVAVCLSSLPLPFRVSRIVINYVFINFRMCDDDDGGDGGCGGCGGCSDDAVFCTLFPPRPEPTIRYSMRCEIKY